MVYLFRSLVIFGFFVVVGFFIVFKFCIGGNYFYSVWKVVKVIEIFKKNSKIDVLNYRFLFLLLILSKFFKSQVCYIIDEYFVECGIENKK